jgi:hypothetical protein
MCVTLGKPEITRWMAEHMEINENSENERIVWDGKLPLNIDGLGV